MGTRPARRLKTERPSRVDTLTSSLEPTQAESPALLAEYEGLVISTQRKYDGIKRWDPEEVRQLLRLGVWKALLAWDPREPRTRRRILKGENEKKLRDAFVYGCLHNCIVDIHKRDKEQMLLIEDIAPTTQGNARERFELKHFGADHEVFDAVEETAPHLPNTLNHNERSVMACMYLGYNGPETAEKLGLTRQQVANAVRAIREKMSDWRPKKTVAPEPTREPIPAPVAV